MKYLGERIDKVMYIRRWGLLWVFLEVIYYRVYGLVKEIVSFYGMLCCNKSMYRVCLKEGYFDRLSVLGRFFSGKDDKNI